MSTWTHRIVVVASMPVVAILACSGSGNEPSTDGTIAAGVAPVSSNGNSACAQFCHKVFGANTSAAGQCTSQAAKGMGLCYQCGPAAPPGLTLCGQTCVNTSTDVNHCGACTTVCMGAPNATPACSGGVCGFTCNAGFGNCNGNPADGCETNLNTSTNNCGACGHACTAANASSSCSGGTCGFTCNAGFGDCNGNPADGCETNLNTSNANCGACGNACPSTALCINGTCQSNCSPLIETTGTDLVGCFCNGGTVEQVFQCGSCADAPTLCDEACAACGSTGGVNFCDANNPSCPRPPDTTCTLPTVTAGPDLLRCFCSFNALADACGSCDDMVAICDEVCAACGGPSNTNCLGRNSPSCTATP